MHNNRGDGVANYVSVAPNDLVFKSPGYVTGLMVTNHGNFCSMSDSTSNDAFPATVDIYHNFLKLQGQ